MCRRPPTGHSWILRHQGLAPPCMCTVFQHQTLYMYYISWYSDHLTITIRPVNHGHGSLHVLHHSNASCMDSGSYIMYIVPSTICNTISTIQLKCAAQFCLCCINNDDVCMKIVNVILEYCHILYFFLLLLLLLLCGVVLWLWLW